MKKNKNINFVLVGAKATGKTVYLASLYLKTKFITSKNAKTTAYLKNLADTLLEGKYPSATSGSLYDLLFDYKNEDFNCTIQFDDVDGYFIETLSEKDENTQRERDKFINKLSSSEGIIFFFPYETETYEKSIKEFNYQIDTVISTLKEIHEDKDKIPVPVSILVTKWDMNSAYKSEDEEDKAIEYIENHKFFKLAKEKIEQNFNNSKIIPISAIGSDINKLEPYNLEKPIDFFLTKVYTIWTNRLSELEEKPEEQLIFLSKIYTDIQFYKNGLYKELYLNLEEEYGEKLLQRAKLIKNLKEFSLFEDEKAKTIDALSFKNKDKIKKIKKKLIQKRYLKVIPIFAVAGIIFILYTNQQTIKSESELFESIKIEYANHNYKKALISINEYQDKYIENIEHKNEIIEIKSLIKKEEIVLKAQRVMEDKTLQSIQSIDSIFSSFSKFGIVEKSLSKELMNKKNELLFQNSILKLKDDIKNLDFEKSILLMEERWKDNYKNRELFIKILNKKFNIDINKFLKSISKITNMDEYNNLLEKLNQIKTIQKNSVLKKLNYRATLSPTNKNNINQQIKLQAKYNQLLTNGIQELIVSFGTDYEENEPLGFNCSSEYQIEMELNNHVYNYKNRTNCLNSTMEWNPTNTFFRKGLYFIKITEIDLTDNDHYDNGSFSLTNNDLIQIYNQKYLKKDIGSGYFIGLKRR